MKTTVLGLFDKANDAQEVMNELKQKGIPQKNMSMIKDTRAVLAGSTGSGDREEGGLWEQIKEFFGFGVSDREGNHYLEGLRRGGILVRVECDEQETDGITDVMERHDVVNIDERASEWEKSGWTNRGAVNEKEAIVPVVEEDLQVGKRQVSRGGVRIYRHVTEEPIEETVKLRDERVRVDRKPTNRPVDRGDETMFTEQRIEMSETAEEPVVSKQARVIEEIIVRKDVNERTETIRDSVRRTDVDVTQTGSDQNQTANDLGRHENDWRNYYNAKLSNTGYTYNQYGPAYRYGYTLASDPRYRGKQWSAIESDARRAWEERNKGTWEQFKDAIRYAWDRVAGAGTTAK